MFWNKKNFLGWLTGDCFFSLVNQINRPHRPNFQSAQSFMFYVIFEFKIIFHHFHASQLLFSCEKFRNTDTYFTKVLKIISILNVWEDKSFEVFFFALKFKRATLNYEQETPTRMNCAMEKKKSHPLTMSALRNKTCSERKRI